MAAGGVSNRLGRQQSRRDTPTSHWNIDGDDMNRVDIDVRWVGPLSINKISVASN